MQYIYCRLYLRLLRISHCDYFYYLFSFLSIYLLLSFLGCLVFSSFFPIVLSSFPMFLLFSFSGYSFNLFLFSIAILSSSMKFNRRCNLTTFSWPPAGTRFHSTSSTPIARLILGLHWSLLSLHPLKSFSNYVFSLSQLVLFSSYFHIIIFLRLLPPLFLLYLGLSIWE